MKVNKAPEKIYLQVCGDCEENECQSCKFEDLEDNVTWSKDPIFKKDVEYTRIDAFIDKACEWLTQYILYHDQIDIFEMENDFRKAMEE